MDALNLEDVKSRLVQGAGPYEVCDGVSVAAFNAYVGGEEELRVALRFLELSDDGRILIVELLISKEHESATRTFEHLFLTASGNGLEVGRGGSMTASRDALPSKEADATYGPKGSTPNRTPPPPPRTIRDWLTLAVEVGWAQDWESLTTAAEWWAGYAGIQYVLLLKINASATEMEYRLYDITAPVALPDVPTQSGIIEAEPNAPPVPIQFDMRRILSIPADRNLPRGMNEVAVVNLRTILDEVIDHIIS